MNYNYYNSFTQEQLNDKLSDAAYSNDLELIKQLLTSSKLNLHAQINADSRFLANSCSHRDINILKYALTSPELKEHADIHADSERALCCAIYEVDIPLIKYLLTSPELKDHSNLYHLNDNNHNYAMECVFKVREFANSAKLIDYFTLDYAIETKDTKIYLELLKYADDTDLRKQIINNLLSNMFREKDGMEQQKLKMVFEDIFDYANMRYTSEYVRENIIELLSDNIMNQTNQKEQEEVILLLKKIDPCNNFFKPYELSQELNKELHINEKTQSKKMKP